MSTLLDRARMMFAAAIAATVGNVAQRVPGSFHVTWAPFNARLAHYQHSRHTVAQDKRAARKARNVKRNKAHV